MKKSFLKIAAALISTVMLLTSCGEVVIDFSKKDETAESVENSVAPSSEVPEESSIDFQKVFDTVELPAKFSGSKRYVLVNDYDHDGRDEAFGFFGIQIEKDYGTRSIGWEDMQIYYIDADGNISPVHTMEQAGYYSTITGAPSAIESESANPEDFSGCYFETESNTFLVLETVYEDDLYYGYDMLSSNQGQYTISCVDEIPQKTEDGRIIVSAWDEEFEYEVKDGCLKEKNTYNSLSELENGTAPVEEPSQNSETIQDIWKTYVRDSGENELYFLQSDYDGDGVEEAYGITGDEIDEDGFTNNVRIYFITSNGTIFVVKDTAHEDTTRYEDALYGVLHKTEGYFLECGKQKFIIWEIDGGGSASISVILGVKNGVPYQPEISGKYQWFHKEKDGTYVGTVSDFSKGYHDFIDYTFEFDPSTGEFERKS